MTIRGRRSVSSGKVEAMDQKVIKRLIIVFQRWWSTTTRSTALFLFVFLMHKTGSTTCSCLSQQKEEKERENNYLPSNAHNEKLFHFAPTSLIRTENTSLVRYMDTACCKRDQERKFLAGKLHAIYSTEQEEITITKLKGLNKIAYHKYTVIGWIW